MSEQIQTNDVETVKIVDEPIKSKVADEQSAPATQSTSEREGAGEGEDNKGFFEKMRGQIGTPDNEGLKRRHRRYE